MEGQDASAGAPLAPGTQVGEYVIERELGTGAFGTVYRAKQPVIDKPVAIKVLAMRYSVDPDMVARFIDEARAANHIDHPAIIDIFSFGRLPDGRRFCVMECLEGQPLDELLEARGALSPEAALAILEPIGAALDAAHAAGIAHRDIKPANIFVCAAGPAKLLDFGVAKLMDMDSDAQRTATGVAVGTPAYMAPEQCLGAAVDTRVDLYSFGVLAFRVLAGRLPFEADSNFSMMAAHINDPPPPIHRLTPGLSPAVSKVLRHLMAKSPADRPESATAAVKALREAFGAGRGVPVAALVAAAALVVLGVITAVAWPTEAPVVDAAVVVVDAAPDPDLAVDVAPPPDAAPDAGPTSVAITLDQLPAGARVLLGDTVLQVVDGKVTLDRGEAPVTLRIEATGYKDREVTLTPDEDATADAKLERRRRAPKPPTGTKKPPNQHSLEPW